MEYEGIKDLERMSYEAEAALVVYGLRDGDVREEKGYEAYYNAGPSAPSHFLSLHKFRSGKACEGSPISKRKLMKLLKRVMPSLNDQMAFLPDHVIGYTSFNTTMLWWRPAETRHLFFDKSTGIPSGKAPLPALLFRFNGSGLSTFALKENKRPTPDTEMYYTPFFNWQCMGNVKLPEHPTPSDTAKLEDLFFRSAFTFHNPPTLEGTTGDGLWKSLVGSGKTEFPCECLVKAGKVRDLYKRSANDY
ncbi:MAG: hypothetical protein ACHQ0Y_04920 [Thermodesulfovibrionales bacterium]